MKILEYYNNLRKKRIVAIAALVVMALVLVVTPLTALADDYYTYVGNLELYYGDVIYIKCNSGDYDVSRYELTFYENGKYLQSQIIGLTSTSTYECYGIQYSIMDEMLCIKNMNSDTQMNIKVTTYCYSTPSNQFNFGKYLYVKTYSSMNNLALFRMVFDDAATMVTTMLTFMQQFLTFMTANPILLIPLIVFLVGVAIFFLVPLIKD